MKLMLTSAAILAAIAFTTGPNARAEEPILAPGAAIAATPSDSETAPPPYYYNINTHQIVAVSPDGNTVTSVDPATLNLRSQVPADDQDLAARWRWHRGWHRRWHEGWRPLYRCGLIRIGPFCFL